MSLNPDFLNLLLVHEVTTIAALDVAAKVVVPLAGIMAGRLVGADNCTYLT